jgi:hypothetical protein
VSAWITRLSSEHPTFIFRSASIFLSQNGEPPTTGTSDDAIGGDVIINYLQKRISKKVPLTVAVVGTTNVRLFTSVRLILMDST